MIILVFQEARQLQDAMDKEKEAMNARMEAMQSKIKEDSNNFSKGNDALKQENQRLLDQMEKERQNLELKLAQDKLMLEQKMKDDAKKLDEEKALMQSKLAEENEKLAQRMVEEQAKQNDEKNEILQLYEKLKKEIDARKNDLNSFKDQMKMDQEDVRNTISRGTSQIRELLENEKKDRATQMAETHAELGMLMEKAESDAQQFETMHRVIQDMEYLTVTPLSVYFTAFRNEPYLDGGEEYLTFNGCSVNVGNAMDPKSGIFTAPFKAAYMFSLHVCTHDLKKALIAIRRNGVEVASLYDQVMDVKPKHEIVFKNIFSRTIWIIIKTQWLDKHS